MTTSDRPSMSIAQAGAAAARELRESELDRVAGAGPILQAAGESAAGDKSRPNLADLHIVRHPDV